MNETVKTLLFVCVAAVAVVAAWAGRPTPVGVAPPDQIGKVLFPDFNDPYQATSMQVVELDPDRGEIKTFEIDQKQGLWVIPSHENYPADAEERLKDAATLLVDLKVINVQSDQRKDHALFGVVEPTAENSNQGQDAVGKLIRMQDENGNLLANLIIGKEVKGQEGQRYARVPAKDPVYTVKIDPTKVSTKFEDWIEQDVLSLEAFDIDQISIDDYSINPVFRNDGGIALNEEPRFDLTVRWDTDNAEWKLGEMLEFRGGRMQPTELLETEELDREVLDRMKNALADLQIVDVRAKPAGLGAGLKADQGFWQDQEGINSLVTCGFYPVRGDDGALQLRSTDGQIGVITKNGIEYTLRFGQIAGVDKETEGDETEGDKLRRFVMISTSLHEPSFPPPELEAIPEAASDDPPGDAGDDPVGEQPEGADEPVPTNETSESVEPSAAAGDRDGASDDSDNITTGDSADESSADEAMTESTDEADMDQSTVGAEDVNAERDRIVKENQRKLDEYQEKRKQAEDKVKELNFRFADWYYVVSDDVYHTIHLSRADVIREREGAAEQGLGIDAFRKLEDTGLSRDAEESDEP